MSKTPETDGLRFPKPMECFEAVEFLLDHARRLERERDEARTSLFCAEVELARWLEWARMHGRLDHAGGIADRTREILSENDRNPDAP